MKKFLLKLTLVILPFIILLLILNYMYKESYYYNTVCSSKKRFESVPKGIQLANLGSSQGFAFDYEDFPEYKTFNFSIEWQHNKYNYYILKQYAGYFAPHSICLIPVSYFDITRVEKEPASRYYGILSKENFPDWNITGNLSYLFPIMISENLWERLCINESNSPFISILNHSICEKEDARTLAAALFAKYTENSSVEKSEEGFKYNIEAVSKIIDFCYENEIIPALVSTPIIDCLNEMYSDIDFFDTFYRFTDELKKKYPQILYFDYSNNDDYSKDWSLFYDAGHINKKGKKKFTAQIVQDLKNEELLQ